MTPSHQHVHTGSQKVSLFSKKEGSSSLYSNAVTTLWKQIYLLDVLFVMSASKNEMFATSSSRNCRFNQSHAERMRVVRPYVTKKNLYTYICHDKTVASKRLIAGLPMFEFECQI